MRVKTFQSRRRQRGIGYTGSLLIVSVCVFFALFGFKVGPHYFENWTVTKVAEELTAKPDVLKQSRSKVYAYINQAYKNNNLWSLNAEDTIVLERDAKQGYLVTVQYERRARLFHNIDVVTSFNTAANE